MEKRRFAVYVFALAISLFACQLPTGLESITGSSGKIPSYPNAQNLALSETDRVAFISAVFGSRYLLYSSTTSISWVSDTGSKVRQQFDKLLSDSNWRVESDWYRSDQYYVSLWRKGDLRVLLAYLDNLNTGQISDLKRQYGISVPEPGSTLIVTHLWDTTQLLPSPTPTNTATPLPTFTSLPTSTQLPTFTQPPTFTPRPTSRPMPTPLLVNFREEFDGSGLDKSTWEVVGPAVEVKGGVMTLKSTLAVFPYVYAKQNPFPVQGNFVLEVAFRYLTVAEWGVGFVADKVLPPAGPRPQFTTNPILYLWQDAQMPLRVDLLGIKVFPASKSDLARHTVELQYSGKYDVLVDGTLVYTSPPTSSRPSALWIGNPANLVTSAGWTSLEIDYIRIRSTP